ncbi:MAG: hypothetical protein HY812_10920 [Planctomycetes bacterium]|nr:hypothetical protein [Planctomycetota bacterium]
MHVSRVCTLLFGAALLPNANAGDPIVRTTTNTDGTKTTTITVTPEGKEEIRDFHIRPCGTNTKVPKGDGYSFGGTSGWENDDNNAWRSWGSGSASSATLGSGGATFTITVPANHTAYSTFKWRTTNNGSKTSVPDESSSSVVGHGTSDPNKPGIPFVAVALLGPSTAQLGSTVTYLADNPIGETETLTYTIYFSRSLDPRDSTRINQADMVPESLGFGLSTNSRTGTTTPGEGIRTATYFGNMRNHVILDVPNESSLVGQTYYLQVEWSDGMSSAPVAVTFTSG